MTAYRFIDEYKDRFGVRWLLRRLNIFPNAYNYKKQQKAAYVEKNSVPGTKSKLSFTSTTVLTVIG